MKSIPNLEMPPASTPGPKADAAGDKQELSGKGQPTAGLAEMCGLRLLCNGRTMSHFLRTSMAQQAVTGHQA